MLGDQKVDEFGELSFKCQNKNRLILYKCRRGTPIRPNFNPQKLVLTNSSTFWSPNISSYTVFVGTTC